MPSGRNAFLLVLTAVCLLAAACRKDDIERTPEAFGSIRLQTSSVELTPGGSAEIAFSVQDGGFSRVSLCLADGTPPQYFSLAGFDKVADGQYVATVSDNGVATDYSQEACIVISTEGQLDIASERICVNCGKTYYPEMTDTGLPVVYLDTDGGRSFYPGNIELPAVLKIRGTEKYAGLRPLSCTVEGHGNISRLWDKKPCRLTLRDSVPMLGMPPGKHWLLLANFADRTLMRNMVAMKVASLTSLCWTPRCVPVELVLNGSHQGTYLLIEKVEVDEHRLNLQGDGSFLLELDFHYDNERQWMDPHGLSRNKLGIPFAIAYPAPRDLSAGEEARIKQYITDLADLLYSDSFADPEEGYAKWLDEDSFADYWIVYEVLGNHELANPGSIYFHRNADGRLEAGPCWDFDICLRGYITTAQEWTGLLNRDAIWYSRLFRDPAFVQKVRLRYQELLPQLQGVADYIDECGKLLEASAGLNFAMWDPTQDRWQNGGLLINGDEDLEFGQAVQKLREVYLRRLELVSKSL